MLFSEENTELYDRENNLGDFGENFYDQNLGENKPPSEAESIGSSSKILDHKDPTRFLDSDSQFAKEFFEFFSTVDPQLGSRSPGTIKSPLMTRSNSNSSTFEGLSSRQPLTMNPIVSQKIPIQREDSLNEVLSVIRNDEKNLNRPQNLTLRNNFGGDHAQDIEAWVKFLTHSAQSSPVGDGPKFPPAFPQTPTQHDNGQQSSSDVPEHSGHSNALPPADTHHTYISNTSDAQFVAERESPERFEEFSWEIQGIKVKLEPNEDHLQEDESVNLIYAPPESTSRPASAFPIQIGEEQPPRPFSVSSLPPDVAVPSPGSPFIPDSASKLSGRKLPTRKTTAAPIRKRKIKTEPDFRDTDSPMEVELPPPRQYNRRKPLDKDDPENFEEWRKRRDRNNDAVRRARAKKRMREMVVEQKCEALSEEVERLRSELEAERKMRIHAEELLQQSRAGRKSHK